MHLLEIFCFLREKKNPSVPGIFKGWFLPLMVSDSDTGKESRSETRNFSGTPLHFAVAYNEGKKRRKAAGKKQECLCSPARKG